MIGALWRFGARVHDGAMIRLWQVRGRLALFALGVAGAKEVRFFGLPVVSLAPGSSITLGPRVVLCSHPRFTALGVSRPVVIRTLRAGARICIGADVGISGGVICAAVSVEIGDRCLLGADVQITDTDFHSLAPEDRRFENRPEWIASAPVIIEDNVFLGAGVRVLKGVRIGRNSVVGFGIGLAALLFLFQAVFPGFEGVQVGIRLDMPDMVTLLIAAATLLRLGLRPQSRPKLWAWYVFVLAVLLSLGTGLLALGTAAGVGARPYFYAIVLGTYALTFPGDAKLVRQLLSSLAWVCVCLVLLTVARWAITYLPIPSLLPASGRFSSSEASLLRVIPSFEAIVVAQVAVVALFYPSVAPALRWLRLALPMLILTVVALQHRSVWLSMLAGIGVRSCLPQAGRKAMAQLAVMAILVAMVVVPLVLSGRVGDAGQDIARSADRAAAMSDTAQARFGSWDFMLRKWIAGGPIALLFGLPMGTSTERVLVNQRRELVRVDFQAHNYFVQTLFNTGLIGIFSSLGVYLYVLVAMYRGLSYPDLAHACASMFLLTAMQLVYYLPYGVDYLQGLVLGVGGALALTIRTRRKTTSSVGIPASVGLQHESKAR